MSASVVKASPAKSAVSLEIQSAIAAFVAASKIEDAASAAVEELREKYKARPWLVPSKAAAKLLGFPQPLQLRIQVEEHFSACLTNLREDRDYYTRITTYPGWSARELDRYDDRIALVEEYQQEALAHFDSEDERCKPRREAEKVEDDAVKARLDAKDHLIMLACNSIEDARAKAAVLIEHNVDLTDEDSVRFLLVSLTGRTAVYDDGVA